MFPFIKALISGCIIAGASELSKRSPLNGAILLSVPLTSLLTAIWLHIETRDSQKIATMLENVFWAHIPTLTFFVLCPIFLRAGYGFWVSMALALVATTAVFFIYAQILKHFGIQIYD